LIALLTISYWQINAFVAFLLSAIFAGVLIPKILLIAFRRKLFDEPDERKIHHSTVPRLGGIAFEPVIIFCVFFLLMVDLLSGQDLLLNEFSKNVIEISSGICGLILLYLIGIADDLIGVKYRAKFAIQIVCGLLFVMAGLYVSDFHGLLFLHNLPAWFAIPLSVILIVFIINAMNLIDGIDGLASGLSAVALFYYGLFFFTIEQYAYSIIAFSTLGTVVPFFYYNVFGIAEKQKKIFMGDTGSLTIGIILCLLSIKLANSPVENCTNCNPIAIGFAPLLVPCMDVVRVFLHRLKSGKSPFLPDQSHIHHKFLKVGMNQRAAMLTIISISIFCTLLVALGSRIINVNILYIFVIAAYTVGNCWLSKKIKEKNIEW
jgi:UDP-N-acetylmuramyl pentapeptide phosphotransferase/UDP-N-acetylglucosamine-1-phosphate transferase